MNCAIAVVHVLLVASVEKVAFDELVAVCAQCVDGLFVKLVEDLVDVAEVRLGGSQTPAEVECLTDNLELFVWVVNWRQSLLNLRKKSRVGLSLLLDFAIDLIQRLHLVFPVNCLAVWVEVAVSRTHNP